jgi:hypothetical protein
MNYLPMGQFLKLLFTLFFFFGWSVCSAQKNSYWDLQVGLGSYINSYDGKFANFHNPRGLGPEVVLLRGRDRKGLGYEYGICYRHTASEGLFFLSNQRIYNFQNAGFILLPVFLTYSFRNLEPSRKLSLKVRTGVYAGWMLYGDDYLLYQNGNRTLNGYNATPSRFPTFDAFGGQLGLKVEYAYKGHRKLYLEIRTILDASTLIYPRYVPFNISFANYQGRLIGLGTNF